MGTLKTLKIYHIATSAVIECMNPMACACSNPTKTARDEVHCKALLLSH